MAGVLLAAGSLSGGCAGLGKDIDRKPAALGKEGVDPEEVQGQLMSFTDTFISIISQQWGQTAAAAPAPTGPQAATPQHAAAPSATPEVKPAEAIDVAQMGTPGDRAQLPATDRARRAALEIKISNVSAALEIASSPNSLVGVADMITMITLQRMILEDSWTAQTFGADKAARIVAAYKDQEASAWRIGKRVFTDAQQQQLTRVIAWWRKAHPDQRYIAGVRLQAFSKDRAVTALAQEDAGPGSLLALVGLDPLANLDPTVREVQRSRLLAERIFFYTEHSPQLIKWQTESLYTGFLGTPEVKAALASVGDVTKAADNMAATAERLRADIAKERHDALEDLFTQLKREREDTIQQLADSVRKEREATLHDIDQGQDKLRGTLSEVRETVKSTESLSNSLKGTLQTADTLMQKFAPTPGAEKRDALMDFKAAAEQTAVTVDKLNTLAEKIDKLLTSPELDAKSGKLRGVVDSFQGGLRDTVDHAFWWLVALSVVAAFFMGASIAFGLSAHKAMERRGAAKRRERRAAAA
jgi:hypothetical protein